MIKEIQNIYVSYDCDGVLTDTKFWSGNAAAWMMGSTFLLPPEGILADAKKRPIIGGILYGFHRIQKAHPEGKAALDKLSEIAQTHGIAMTKGITSGRTSRSHPLTENLIVDNDFSKHFTEVNHNPNKVNHSWKEAVVREKLASYDMVIHLDDDIRAAMSVARVDADRVMVFLIKNFSNCKPLLWIGKKRGLELPKNMYIADGVLDAAKKLELAFLECTS